MLRTWIIEYLQNIPLTLAFVYGYAQLYAGKPAGAILTVLTGTAAGALVIRSTEPLIADGPVERPAVTLGNFILFSAAILLAIPYFGWPAGGWLTDLVLGGAIGALAAFAQARAAGKAISVQHTGALAAASGSALLFLRFWALQAPPPAAAIGLAALITTIIVPIEYRHSR